MTSHISAFRADTGEQVTIPAHWLDHPTIGRDFRKTPPQKAAANKKTPSVGDSTEKEK